MSNKYIYIFVKLLFCLSKSNAKCQILFSWHCLKYNLFYIMPKANSHCFSEFQANEASNLYKTCTKLKCMISAWFEINIYNHNNCILRTQLMTSSLAKQRNFIVTAVFIWKFKIRVLLRPLSLPLTYHRN